jgi:hypothetical protein
MSNEIAISSEKQAQNAPFRGQASAGCWKKELKHEAVAAIKRQAQI